MISIVKQAGKKACTAVLALSLFCTGLFAQSKDFNTGKYLEIQSRILRILEAQYVDSVELASLLGKGIDAMLATLDPYTVFVPEEDEENLDIMTTASYGGIGALIQKTPSGYIIISEPYEGSAAAKAGLHPSDTIVSIDGMSTKNLAVDQCSSRMRGRPGTELTLGILPCRGGDTVYRRVSRERIHIPDVVYHGFLDDTTGYIQIGGFTVGGAKDVRKAVEDLRQRGRMQRLVLDLRGNGGGLMSEAVDIVSLFVPKGTLVVSAKGKFPNSNFEYRTDKEPVDTLLPLMVLVNSSSASSSEIVAGALQDMDRAVVAGTRTYGKGLVQTIRPTGYNTSLKVTTSKYYTPSGRCVQAIDYSHRNADGSVGHIPDSLKREFKTRNGRTVYDGGGIAPDLEVASQTYSRSVVALIYSNLLSEYANLYFKRHPQIATPREFRMTESDYADFVALAATRELDIRSEAQIEMEKLIRTAKEEGTADESITVDMENLLKKLSPSKEEFLNANKEIIKPLIEDEIVLKYYFRRGGAESALRHDLQLKEALKLWKPAEVTNPSA